MLSSKSMFINIHKYFTNEKIWPRGLPLDSIEDGNKLKLTRKKGIKIGFWQGLADIDPDVDAIYRLVIGKKVKFQKRPAVAIAKGVYTPSNTQNTLWSKKFFACMYFPITISWRFADILRGYIAQRILWENNYCMGYTSASLYQERARSDYMKDFKDEIDCNLNVRKAVEIFDGLSLSGDLTKDLVVIYNELAKNGIIPQNELVFLDAWLKDINRYL